MTKNILITDSNHSNALEVALYLKKRGFRIFADGGNSSLISLVKSVSVIFQDNIYKYPPQYIDDYLSKNSIREIIPIGAKSVEYLSANCKIFRTYALLPNISTINTCFDKKDFAKLLKELDLPYIEEIAPLENNGSYEFNEDVFIKNISELDKNHFGILRANKSITKKYFNNKKQIAQKLLEGDGFGFFAICQNGVVLSSYCHHRIREYPFHGGVSSKCEVIDNEKIKKIGFEFIKKMNYTGQIMVEMKKNLSGELFIVEVNPKFWGSIGLALRNKMPIIESYLYRKKIKLNILNAKRYQLFLTHEIKSILDPKTPTNFKYYILRDLVNPTLMKDFNLFKFFFIKFMAKLIPDKLKILISRFRLYGISSTIKQTFGMMGIEHNSSVDHIYEKLFVGPAPSHVNQVKEFDYVISLREEKKGFEDINFPFTEYKYMDPEKIMIAVQNISNLLQKNKKILLHCREGKSRAMTVAIACLIYTKNMSPIDAISFGHNARKQTNLLPEHVSSIYDFSSYIGAQGRT